jgi:hypothetical protein
MQYNVMNKNITRLTFENLLKKQMKKQKSRWLQVILKQGFYR